MVSRDEVPQDLVGCFQQNAETFSEKVCLHFLHGEGSRVDSITYYDLWRKANGFREALKIAGIKSGEVVLIFLNHHPDMAACYLGTMQIGAIPSFMPSPSTKQHPDLYWQAHQTLFQRIGPRAIVTDAAQAEQMNRYGLADEAACFIDVDTVEEADDSFPPYSVDPEQIALLQHSSGTTGLKKGIALSHQAILNQVRAYACAIDLKDEDTIVSWLPLYHDMGLITSLIMPLVMGRTTVLMDPFQWVARPGMLFEAITKYDGRFVWLPNFAFEHLCRTTGRMDPMADLSRVRAFINCSEPCKLETFHRFADTFSSWGVRPDQLQACYALAENVFAVTQTPLGREPIGAPAPAGEKPEGRPIASVGKLISGIELCIMDQEGHPLSPGQIGEITIRGESIFKEYFMLRDLTSERINDGYFYTRDIGFQKDGELYILGRGDDLIIVNGRNHYAHDLEALVNKVEGLKSGRCATFGLFNDTLGSEEVVVVAERALDAKHTNTDLKRTIKDTIFIEADLVIRDAHIVNADWLVKTTSGKISREGNKDKYLLETRKTA